MKLLWHKDSTFWLINILPFKKAVPIYTSSITLSEFLFPASLLTLNHFNFCQCLPNVMCCFYFNVFFLQYQWDRASFQIFMYIYFFRKLHVHIFISILNSSSVFDKLIFRNSSLLYDCIMYLKIFSHSVLYSILLCHVVFNFFFFWI